jgi:hypothetical protein
MSCITLKSFKAAKLQSCKMIKKHFANFGESHPGILPTLFLLTISVM